MNGRSIRLRLLVASAVSVVVALAIAGFGLTLLFERHVERRIEQELTDHLNQLIAAIAVAADGTVSMTNSPTDPRFASPLSGLYWQVEDLASGARMRSRSLWDSTLPAPSEADPGALEAGEIRGPGGSLLVAVVRTIDITAGGTNHRFRLVVAEDHGDVDIASRDFGYDLMPALAILALVLIVAAGVQVTVGLLPLERLRRAVSDIVAGRTTRLADDAPREVQPLATEINRLLEAQEKALGKARTRAADLAHGLKTPLQVLSADVRALRERGETALADEIDQVAGTIRRHVERELARARAAPSASLPVVRSVVADVAGRVIAVVKRTPRGERLTFKVDIAPGVTATVDETDLAEVLGNLVENASRFAASTVKIAAREALTETRIEVSDDGPGIPPEAVPAALARGGRVDLRGNGSGLGLAIVSDVVEAYGGTFTMESGAPGLRAVVTFPSAAGGAGT
jgi:signal transduction histidine kinase